MTSLPRWMLWALMGVATAALHGCNIVGPAAYIVAGQEKMPAAYELADRPTLVFVDDRQNVLSRRALRQMIAETASEELMVNEIVTVTYSPRDALSVVASETNEDLLSIEEIGRAVGAEQVIYVEALAFSPAPPATLQPSGACTVRVIDVVNRVKLFPSDESADPSHLVQVTLPRLTSETRMSASIYNRLEDALAKRLGDGIAKVFYKHVPDELGSHLEPR